jgi:transposase
VWDGAHIITTPINGCTGLKSWAMRIANKRDGIKKAKVALARKLAVIMHRMSIARTEVSPILETRPMRSVSPD